LRNPAFLPANLFDLVATSCFVDRINIDLLKKHTFSSVNLEDNPSSKDLVGTAKTDADEKETKLDAAFHAALK
jgi:hypothetical protein